MPTRLHFPVLLLVLLLVSGCWLTDRYTTTTIDPTTGEDLTVEHPSPLEQGITAAIGPATGGNWLGAIIAGVTAVASAAVAARQTAGKRRNLRAAAAAVTLAENLKDAAITGDGGAAVRHLADARVDQEAAGIRPLIQKLRGKT